MFVYYAGAQNLHMESSSVLTSKNGVNCSGDEANIAACNLVVENTNRQCGTGAALIRCFNIGITSVPPECLGSTENSSATTVTATALTNVTTQTGSDSGGSTGSPAPSTSTVQTMPTADTNEATPPQVTPSKSFFAPPTLYYLIGTLAAIVIAAVLLILLIVIYFCCRQRRKGISPTDSEQQQQKEGHQLENLEESIENKDHTPASHHQIQSSQPIYEAINGEGSSSDSQGSPCSKSLLPSTTNTTSDADVYSTLDQSATYAQISPHITSPRSAGVSFDIGNADSDYQQLVHSQSRTGSMKRELPKRPSTAAVKSTTAMAAVNPMTMAMARGEVDERDQQSNGSANGSPTSMFKHTGRPPVPPTSRQQQDLEQVQLTREVAPATTAGQQENFYHILEAPPDYNTLEQVDECSEVSTTAVCNNGVGTGGRRYTETPMSRGSQHSSHERFVGSHHSSQERFATSQQRSRSSTTLPSGGHQNSPHLSSRTSSVSSSGSRPNRSPLTRRVSTDTSPTSRGGGGGGGGDQGSVQVSLSSRLSDGSDQHTMV